MNRTGSIFLFLAFIAVGFLLLVLGHLKWYKAEMSPSSVRQGTVATASSAIPEAIATKTAGIPSPSASPTSTWLTYSDHQNGFWFQYPSDCELDTSTAVGAIAFDKCLTYGLDIDIYHKRADQPVLDFWRSASGLIVLSSTPMTINGHPALEIEDQMSYPAEGDARATSDLLSGRNKVSTRSA